MHDSLKSCFAPVADRASHVLVLGSLPGERSLARGEYYAHPRNQFWRLIGDVIGEDLQSMDYEDRLTMLLSAGIALWDVVARAERKGSLDSNIRGAEANALADLAASLPQLRAVAFNGGKAARLGMPLFADMDRLALLPLPSSSPAHARPYAEKRAAWSAIERFIR